MPRKTNFTVNGYHYFRTTITIGKRADGTPVRKQFYGTNKKAAEAKKNEYISALQKGLSVDFQKHTFGTVYVHWLEQVQRPTVGISTYIKYEALYRLYIADCPFSGMRLVDIKALQVQSHYNCLLEKTTAKNIHQLHKQLNKFFNYCIKTDMLTRNPLLGVELPKLLKTTELNTALHDCDIQKLVAACKNNMKYFPFVFACFTGLRAGELLALTYRDLDLTTDMINVEKSVKYLTLDGKFQFLLSNVKTGAGVRRVPILAELKPLLLEHIKNLSVSDDRLLFPSATGTYREHSNFLQAFKRLCNKLEIRTGCTIHSLRHTFCTILARRGVSLLDASRLMGHSNVNITAKIYSHITDADKKNAVQKLSIYFV